MNVRAEESENLVFNGVQTKKMCTKLRVREEPTEEGQALPETFWKGTTLNPEWSCLKRQQGDSTSSGM